MSSDSSESLERSGVVMQAPTEGNAMPLNFSIANILHEKRRVQNSRHSGVQAESALADDVPDEAIIKPEVSWPGSSKAEGMPQPVPSKTNVSWSNFSIDSILHKKSCAVQEENFFCVNPGIIPVEPQVEPNLFYPNTSSFGSSIYKSQNGLQGESCNVLFQRTPSPNTPGLDFSIADNVLHIELELCTQLNSLVFSPPIEYIYSPIEYAFNLHAQFVRKFCNASKKVMFLGMNPGPWGMSQTGVPFGEVAVVRDWFGIKGSVGKPKRQHPQRLVTGLECHRSEISGKRFWGLFQELCGPDPFVFFKNCLIYNLCPIALLSNSGKNITPAEIKASESKALLTLCETALSQVVCLLRVEVIVAVGKFAEKRASIAVNSTGLKGVKVVSIPHPSPRNASNGNNWKELATKILENLGLLELFLPT